MPQHLSKRLGPRAKKLFLQSPSESRVSGLVQLAPSANREALRSAIEHSGGHIRSVLDEADAMTVEISAGQLGKLADMDGVVYVEAGERYSA